MQIVTKCKYVGSFNLMGEVVEVLQDKANKQVLLFHHIFDDEELTCDMISISYINNFIAKNLLTRVKKCYVSLFKGDLKTLNKHITHTEAPNCMWDDIVIPLKNKQVQYKEFMIDTEQEFGTVKQVANPNAEIESVDIYLKFLSPQLLKKLLKKNKGAYIKDGMLYNIHPKYTKEILEDAVQIIEKK